MRVLLDTHVFLWVNDDDPRISPRARAVLEDRDAEVLFSVASAWELAIKVSLGRLRLPLALDDYLVQRVRVQSLTPLAIELSHTRRVATLPPLHRDPFDRMLVAQALVEGVGIMTADRDIARYPVELVW